MTFRFIGRLIRADNTTIKDVYFYNSVVKNGQNGVRIKTVSGATGSLVQNINYENIELSNISSFGVVRETFL